MWRQIGSAALLLIALLAMLFGAFAGFQMLVSPSKFRRWRDREVFEASEPDPSIRPSRYAELGERIAGLFLGVVFSAFSFICAYALLTGKQVSSKEPQLDPKPELGPGWDLLAIGVVVLSSGLYILVRTDSFVRWSFRRLYSRLVRDDALPKFRTRARMFGAMCVIAGVQTLWWWLKRHLH